MMLSSRSWSSVRPTSSSAASNRNRPQSGDDRVKTYGLLRADYRRMLSNIPSITRAVPIRELKREFMVEGTHRRREVGRLHRGSLGTEPTGDRPRQMDERARRSQERHHLGRSNGQAIVPVRESDRQNGRRQSDVYTVIGRPNRGPPRPRSAAAWRRAITASTPTFRWPLSSIASAIRS